MASVLRDAGWFENKIRPLYEDFIDKVEDLTEKINETKEKLDEVDDFLQDRLDFKISSFRSDVFSQLTPTMNTAQALERGLLIGSEPSMVQTKLDTIIGNVTP